MLFGLCYWLYMASVRIWDKQICLYCLIVTLSILVDIFKCADTNQETFDIYRSFDENWTDNGPEISLKWKEPPALRKDS